MRSPGQDDIVADLVFRPLRPDDEGTVRALHKHLTERDTYLRFFPLAPRRIDTLVEMLCRQDDQHVSLGACDGGSIVGVANYTVIEANSHGPVAECAIAVSHPMQHHGIGTALLQRLLEIARTHGVRRLTAFVLAENATMLQVLTDMGWSPSRDVRGPVVKVSIGLADGQTTRELG
jgi:GNAT superfamily N-acetyltransferase